MFQQSYAFASGRFVVQTYVALISFSEKEGVKIIIFFRISQVFPSHSSTVVMFDVFERLLVYLNIRLMNICISEYSQIINLEKQYF